MKTCLTIAGSDCSGGAGIQADLKTFSAHKVYGMSVITAITAQNTQSIQAIHSLPTKLIKQQLRSIFEDIRPDAIKIGMLGTQAIVETVAEQLDYYQASNIVFDPVMKATTGNALLNHDALHSVVRNLIPQVNIITPNLAELMALCQQQNILVDGRLDAHNVELLTQSLFNALSANKNHHRIAILTTGGHLNGKMASDFFIDQQQKHWLHQQKIDTQNHHGTGCTLSSTICAQLTHTSCLLTACQNAKNYLTHCLSSQLNLGKGNGPLRQV